MTSTLPGHTHAMSDLRLLFGPELDDAAIEAALRTALDDLGPIRTSGQVLDEAKRLAAAQLDALARSAGPP